MTGVKHKDLISMISFMYKGETEVGHDDLKHFMEIARKFKIKGLSEIDNDSTLQIDGSAEVTETYGQPQYSREFETKAGLINENAQEEKMKDLDIPASKEFN